MPQIITHRGTVKSVSGKHISVIITQAAACSACAARRMCNASDSRTKVIDVTAEDASEYSVGEEILLVGSVRASLGAVLWAYVVPLVLMVAVLLAALSFSVSEPLSALAAIATLAAYYAVLYMAKKLLARKFSFSIKHIK